MWCPGQQVSVTWELRNASSRPPRLGGGTRDRVGPPGGMQRGLKASALKVLDQPRYRAGTSVPRSPFTPPHSVRKPVYLTPLPKNPPSPTHQDRHQAHALHILFTDLFVK